MYTGEGIDFTCAYVFVFRYNDLHTGEYGADAGMRRGAHCRYGVGGGLFIPSKIFFPYCHLPVPFVISFQLDFIL